MDCRFSNRAPLRLTVTLIALVVILSGCRGIRVDDAATRSPADWRVDDGQLNRDRATHVDLRPPLRLDWRYNAAAAFGTSSPLLFGNTLLVGTRRGDLYAVNIDKGRKFGSKRFAESIEGGIVSSGELVFIPGALGKHSLVAYNLETGKTVWKESGVPVEAGLALAGDLLLAVDVSGQVTARDLETGVVEWSFEFDGLESSEVAPMPLGDGGVILAGNQGTLLRLNAQSGEVTWRRQLPSPVYSGPAAAGSLLYVPGSRGVLTAVDLATGSIAWSAHLGGERIRLTSPAVDASEVYVGTSSGKFLSLDAGTGAVNWQFEGPDVFAAPPLVTPDHVFVGSMGRMLYAFDRRSASLAWEYRLEGRIKSAMAVREGELFVLAEPRHIYRFVPEAGEGQDAD